jgi:addiction module RelE/StbE family toxin
MIQIAFSDNFKKVFAKKIKKRPQLDALFWETVDLFINDPFHPKLKTHKLTGKLKDLWSYSVEYNIRVIFFFEDNNTKAVFIDFGTHDEVY